MITVTIKGRFFHASEQYTLPGSKRLAQKLFIECTHDDKRVKDDIFCIYVFGDDIAKCFAYYPYGAAPKYCSVTAKLSGRYKNQRDSLTLTFRSILWNE